MVSIWRSRLSLKLGFRETFRGFLLNCTIHSMIQKSASSGLVRTYERTGPLVRHMRRKGEITKVNFK